MQRMAELQHDVIGNVDDVADAGDARSFEAVFQPFWRGLDFHVSNDSSSEAAAEFRGLDFYFYGVAGFRRTFRRLGRNAFERQLVDGADFACDSVMAEAIGTIRTDLCVDHGTMGAIFNTGNVRTGKREARGQFLRRRSHVDEVLQPVVNDLHASVPIPLQL